MPLDRYAEKRSFDRTPEPTGKAPKPSHGPLQFCIQRHHATHLHYDLRLEVDGVLKSWAVPKGPTLDPAEKRLAMHVEDHPLEYADFEGVIPKGNYGAGSMMLYDIGTYEVLTDTPVDQQLTRGDFKFRLHGQKLQGDFALVRTKRGKGNEWLLIKKKDPSAQPGWDANNHARSVKTGRTQEEIARNLPVETPKPAHHPTLGIKSPMPKSISPMLAQIGKGAPPPGDWIYEVKWDGVRALCYVEDGRVRMVTRNGNVMDQQYPELSILPHHLKCKTAILDGEIAALDEHGVPSFERLQKRITVGDASAIATLMRSTPVVLFLFDLLYLDGHDLRGVPLRQRKGLLKTILTPGDLILYSDDFEDGAALMDAVKQRGIEGVVGKRPNSLYESRRTSNWIKYKVQNTESFILCGMLAGERDYFGALILGIYDSISDHSQAGRQHDRSNPTRQGGEYKLKWAGNVGTGFDTKMLKTIHSKLAPLATKTCPLEPDKNLPKAGVTWVRPELVCEVKFANWTDEGRLRAPVWVGFRPDIDPSECVRGGVQETVRPPLLDPSLTEAMLTIDGHRLKFTNLPKIYFPEDNYSKRDLLNYYDAVAPLILPHLKDRPLSLKRYPDGIHAEWFFQKEVAASFPKWLRMEVADEIRYVIGDNRATLLFLVNLGCIDHNPWMSRMDSLEHPDYLLIDLDPQDCPYEKIVEAALMVRAKLDLAELESYPKTTGGDGMHIFVPLEPHYTYEQVRGFAELLATLVAHERPSLFTTPRAVSKREKGRVYFDWAQIARGKTISSPYSVRAYPGAPVATPLEWREVTPRLHPEQFTMSNALARFDRVGDLFEGVLKRPQALEHGLAKLSEKL